MSGNNRCPCGGIPKKFGLHELPTGTRRSDSYAAVPDCCGRVLVKFELIDAWPWTPEAQTQAADAWNTTIKKVDV